MYSTERCHKQKLFEEVDLYPVTCEALSCGRTDVEVLCEVIAGGVRIIQLRDKTSPMKSLYAKAIRFRQITKEAGVLFIINDHVDLCIAVDADGVHLGQDDLPIPVARNLLPNKLIGVSTHSSDEAFIAEKEGADYVNIGPIFSTTTKTGGDEGLGPESISRISEKLKIPFTVMGGINLNNLNLVLNHGARRVAMISAITQSADITATVVNLRTQITSLHRQ